MLFHRRSSMWRILASLVHGSTHSSSSWWTESTFGSEASEATVGCSGDWPARKRAADWVRMTRIERLECFHFANDEIMRGNLIVATGHRTARGQNQMPFAAIDCGCNRGRWPQMGFLEVGLGSSGQFFFLFLR
jgi:hypothetical protein